MPHIEHSARSGQASLALEAGRGQQAAVTVTVRADHTLTRLGLESILRARPHAITVIAPTPGACADVTVVGCSTSPSPVLEQLTAGASANYVLVNPASTDCEDL